MTSLLRKALLSMGVPAEEPKRAPLESAEVKAREIGRQIMAELPAGWGYFLALSSFGENGHLTYLSSIERTGAVKLLRELAGKMERKEPHL